MLPTLGRAAALTSCGSQAIWATDQPERSTLKGPPTAETSGASAQGTRSVERTLALLRHLSQRGEFGWRLFDLAEEIGLDRGTCHRMLSCLVREGFAQRHPNDVRYYAGPMMFEIGLAMPHYQSLRECVEPQLERLSRELDCIASFSLRSRNELVCAFQKHGHSELPGMLIRVGTRRPLIAAVGGLAILQRLPPGEAALILEDNLQAEISRRGSRRLPDLDRMRQRSERAGYGYTRGDLAPGIWAMAEVVLDESGNPFAALTVAGHESALAESDAEPVHERLLEAVQEITVCAGQTPRRSGADGGLARSA